MATLQPSTPGQASPPGRTGLIDYRTASDGTVRVTGHGLWSADYVDEHFEGLERLLQLRRPASSGVRVLVDLRDAPVQPADAAARVQSWTGRAYDVDDRVAILVASRLLRTQMRRVAMIPNRELFLSEPEALAWLNA